MTTRQLPGNPTRRAGVELDQLSAGATGGLDDAARLGDLGVERLARRSVTRALPDDHVAVAARERQAELGTFGDRAHGTGHDQVPCLALVRFVGEVLGALGEGLDVRCGRRGAHGGAPTTAAAASRNAAFLAIESTNAARRAGSTTARGSPG